MTHLDPRFSGTNDPTEYSKTKPVTKPDGYARTKSQKRKSDKNDPYYRDANFNTKLGIV